MKTRLILLFLLSLLLKPYLSFSQYEEMRILQSPEEMELLKQQKVKELKIYKLENGQEKPFLTRYYDDKGRLVREIKGTTRKNYIYDFKNRIVMIQDSVLISGYYDRDEYEFEFDGRGMLSFVRFPYYNSNFEYDQDKKELMEITMLDLDAYRKRYFRFNDNGQLIEEEFINPDRSKEKIRKLTYNDKGMLVLEDVFKFHTNGGYDTSTTEYTYDNRKQLEKKVSVERSLIFPSNFSEEPVLPYYETSSSISTYFHDAKGNLLEETFAYADQSYGFRIANEYNDKGLKIKEQNFDLKENLKQTLIYKYNFRK